MPIGTRTRCTYVLVSAPRTRTTFRVLPSRCNVAPINTVAERRVDHDLLSRPVNVGPAEAVRRRDRIELLQLPSLARVAIVVQNAYFTQAFRGVIGEFPFHDDVWYAVRSWVTRGAVDHRTQTRNENVALPGGVSYQTRSGPPAASAMMSGRPSRLRSATAT